MFLKVQHNIVLKFFYIKFFYIKSLTWPSIYFALDLEVHV